MQVYPQNHGYFPVVRPTVAVQGAHGIPTQMEVTMHPSNMYQWAPPMVNYPPQYEDQQQVHQLIPLVGMPAAYTVPAPIYHPYQPPCHLPPAYIPQAQVQHYAHKQMEMNHQAAPHQQQHHHQQQPQQHQQQPQMQQQQQPQQVWNNRYVPISLLGSGTYGQVYKCTDLATGAAVAVKVSNREAAYRRSALAESTVLTLLRECENVAVILDTFEDNGHVCIATEMLDINFLELMKSRNGKRLSLANLAHVASNILNTLSVMHTCGYMHCDVKPENVMLRSQKKGCRSACLIDYGAVRRLDDNNYHDIQSLWYRAPEVICSAAYTPKIDVWSVGCLLFELATGTPLFAGSDAKEQLQKIMACMGSPSLDLCQCATLNGHNPVVFAPGARDRSKSLIDEKIRLLHHHESHNSISLFLDLLYRLLACDPESRFSAADALRHPFLNSEESPVMYSLPPSNLSSNQSTPSQLQSIESHGASLSYAPHGMGMSASSPYMDPIPLDGPLVGSGTMNTNNNQFPQQYMYDLARSPLQGSSSVTYVNGGWNQPNTINSPHMSFGGGQFEVYV